MTQKSVKQLGHEDMFLNEHFFYPSCSGSGGENFNFFVFNVTFIRIRIQILVSNMLRPDPS